MEAQPLTEGRPISRPCSLDAATVEAIGRALDAAAALLGGRKAMAEQLTRKTGQPIGASAIGNWKTRGVPIDHCMPIEDLTAEAVLQQGQGEKVTRAQLRPHDYFIHWPDLRQCKAN